MKTKIITVLAVLFTITFQAQAAYVLTFDDIGETEDSLPVPDGYGGFNWGNLAVGAFYYFNPKVLTPNSGFNNGLVSGDYLTTCGAYGIPSLGRITGELFAFHGAYFTAGSRDGLNVQVDGYLDDQFIYSTTVVVDTTGPTWYEFNYENIDELRFSASGGVHHEGYEDHETYFAIDNFTYIPEPTIISLLLLGGVFLRRFNRQLV